MVLGSFLKKHYGKGLVSAPTLNPWWTNNLQFKNKKQKPTDKMQSSVLNTTNTKLLCHVTIKVLKCLLSVSVPISLQTGYEPCATF